MLETTPGVARAVASGKVPALTNMINAARPLGSAVLFSSISAILGNKSNAAYAAANAALDSYATKHADQDMNIHSIQWGAWASIGMAAAHAKGATKAQTLAMGMLSVEDGLFAFSEILQRDALPSVHVVTPPLYWINAAKFVPRAAAISADLRRAEGHGTDWGHSGYNTSALQHPYGARSAGEVVDAADSTLLPTPRVVSFEDVTEVIKTVLGTDAIELDVPLGRQGLESLTSIDLKSKLDELLGAGRVTLQDLMMETPEDFIHGALGTEHPSNSAVGELAEANESSGERAHAKEHRETGKVVGVATSTTPASVAACLGLEVSLRTFTVTGTAFSHRASRCGPCLSPGEVAVPATSRLSS
jgi:hypothetical protein